MKKYFLVFFVLFVIVGLYLVFRPNGSALTPTPLASASPAVSVEARQIDVAGNEFSFEPALINAAAGENIRIVFTNTGRSPHNLVIEGVAQSQVIGGGQSDTLEFVAPAPGSYSFICSIPGHKEAGMKGVLKVE